MTQVLDDLETQWSSWAAPGSKARFASPRTPTTPLRSPTEETVFLPSRTTQWQPAYFPVGQASAAPCVYYPVADGRGRLISPPPRRSAVLSTFSVNNSRSAPRMSASLPPPSAAVQQLQNVVVQPPSSQRPSYVCHNTYTNHTSLPLHTHNEPSSVTLATGSRLPVQTQTENTRAHFRGCNNLSSPEFPRDGSPCTHVGPKEALVVAVAPHLVQKRIITCASGGGPLHRKKTGGEQRDKIIPTSTTTIETCPFLLHLRLKEVVRTQDCLVLQRAWVAWIGESRSARLERLAAFGGSALVDAAARLVLAAWRRCVDLADLSQHGGRSGGLIDGFRAAASFGVESFGGGSVGGGSIAGGAFSFGCKSSVCDSDGAASFSGDRCSRFHHGSRLSGNSGDKDSYSNLAVDGNISTCVKEAFRSGADFPHSSETSAAILARKVAVSDSVKAFSLAPAVLTGSADLRGRLHRRVFGRVVSTTVLQCWHARMVRLWRAAVVKARQLRRTGMCAATWITKSRASVATRRAFEGWQLHAAAALAQIGSFDTNSSSGSVGNIIQNTNNCGEYHEGGSSGEPSDWEVGHRRTIRGSPLGNAPNCGGAAIKAKQNFRGSAAARSGSAYDDEANIRCESVVQRDIPVWLMAGKSRCAAVLVVALVETLRSWARQAMSGRRRGTMWRFVDRLLWRQPGKRTPVAEALFLLRAAVRAWAQLAGSFTFTWASAAATCIGAKDDASIFDLRTPKATDAALRWFAGRMSRVVSTAGTRRALRAWIDEAARARSSNEAARIRDMRRRVEELAEKKSRIVGILVAGNLREKDN
eukprot:TRINITY_DN74858_c0_g1_i1.p1 TRINITY_DN74858_c0_g1~~TRINITY_DN74858_c0_g1_i1.p1  ORF type:complete len:871 (-),score=133.56 TRINITY_DN74858_c0_g1_i1:72-2510(-)